MEANTAPDVQAKINSNNSTPPDSRSPFGSATCSASSNTCQGGCLSMSAAGIALPSHRHPKMKKFRTKPTPTRKFARLRPYSSLMRSVHRKVSG